MKLVLLLVFVLFISGCVVQESIEENCLSANVYDFYEVSSDFEKSVFIGGGVSRNSPASADKSLCNNLAGSCVGSLMDGYFSLSCVGAPVGLCPVGQLCQVPLSGCENAPVDWDCSCDDGGPVEDFHNICNVNGECVAVQGVGSSQCSVHMDCSAGSGCGNGVVEPYLLEECDGFDLNGETCSSLGYSGGILSCNLDCSFNHNGCY